MRVWRLRLSYILTLLLMVSPLNATQPKAASDAPEILASTPPLGWNSYDGYGTTVNEAEFKANTTWFVAHLKPLGWQYLVIDEEWYVTDPIPPGNSKSFTYSMDRFGRYTPALNRFPSAAGDAGFKPLADYVHSLGLKFGIHMIRGIPRQAVEKNLAIADSPYHAAQAADTADTCPWNYDNYGVADTPAGQAYYDSIAKLYAGWGVDLVKADCISSHPYKGDEIRMLSLALHKTGRPIVLSLSPGPAPLDKAGQMPRYAQMWRISDDIWDLWSSRKRYPRGVSNQFPNAATWARFSGPGHWPDADMLPLGRLGPAPGWGKPRETRLTHDEQRTMLTLWVIFRSPLMAGGDLTAADAWTTSLLTNPEVLAVDQHSSDSHPVITTDKTVVWQSKPVSGSGYYLAVFNLGSSAQTIHYEWKDLGLAPVKYKVRNLWERKDIGTAASLDLRLRSHASVLYCLSPP
jgi:alpha-galactosidase